MPKIYGKDQNGVWTPAGGGSATDETLTKSGAPADAAVVGRKFAEQSEAIADYRSQLDGKQPVGNYLTAVPAEYVTETELEAEIDDLKAQGVQQVPSAADGDTVEEQLAWLAENGDASKVYLLADGYLYQWKLTEKEIAGGGYKNWLPLATETYNGTNVYGEKGYVTGYRLSSSGSVSAYDGMLATGFIPASDGAIIRTEGFVADQIPMAGYVISYNASGTKLKHYSWGTSENASAGNAYISEFTLDSATYGTGIAFIRISASAKTSTLPEIVTVNEEIKEGSTTIVKEYAWANTGRAFVPADYEDRIVGLETEVVELNAEIVALNGKLENAKVSRLAVAEIFAPSPQLPADGSETADFDANTSVINCNQIYDYLDALVAKYPRYITKEVVGKDESNAYDWCRYVCSKRCYDAWQKQNYPPMYAWTSGSTTIYSVSVSPRIGDTLYTTTYIGTAKGTVTAVSNANQSRTVGGVAYTRDKTKDVDPTLVYTETAYDSHYVGAYSGFKNGVYNSTKSKISTIANHSATSMTDAAGNTYVRYPLGDRDRNFKSIPSIVIGGSEHGAGEPVEPAIIAARMAKDLCECVNANNPLLNLLKNNYMVVFCPVINPWGFSNRNGWNANGVNLDRNFDTVGWGNDPNTQDVDGDYGGSEAETQHFMNTLVSSKTKIALANHALGSGINSTTGEGVNAGHCHWMLGRDNSKYNNALKSIGETMSANYNLAFTDYGEAPSDTWGKTRSYMDSIGVEGGALEMQSREGFILAGEGNEHTARIMEANYTLLLQFLWMLISKAA